jgi:hypothetical protein
VVIGIAVVVLVVAFGMIAPNLVVQPSSITG